MGKEGITNIYREQLSEIDREAKEWDKIPSYFYPTN